MRNPTRRMAALLRRGVEVALLLAAADPSLPPPTQALLVDALVTPDAEPISPRPPGL
ncbi:hypothetical protein [Micromonospora sp. NPDC047738]|uniref:hypothetical protein n=1 Tax=unclassified Micromonospora TaxID=2617518 RepID=UPI0033C96586